MADDVFKDLTDDKWVDTSDDDWLEEDGWTWGYQTASPEEALPWSDWKVKESANDARDSGDWGKLQLAAGEEFVSTVKDKGDTDVKWLRVTYDDYDSGVGSGSIHWRGQAGTFNQSDNEVVGPTWEAYPAGGANKGWRYIQVKCTG